MEFMGTYEIEQQHGIRNWEVIRYMKRGLWPQPIAPLKCGLVFRTSQVTKAVQKLKSTGQLK
jgi:hypothetical protein